MWLPIDTRTPSIHYLQIKIVVESVSRETMCVDSDGKPMPLKADLGSEHQTKANSKLRFHSELAALNGCLTRLGDQFQNEAYRIVFDRFGERDFLPQAVLNPRRLGAPSKGLCSLWGLSMFENKEQLLAHIKRVIKTAPNFTKLVGDHYVRLSLSKADGLRTAARRDGHFDFYPYQDFEPKEAVTEHGPLPK